ELFPRRHPSLDTLLIFAAASILGGGPVAGVPGVILGRWLSREVREAPHLYTGTRAATAALIVSWIGTLLGGFALASFIARHSETAATAMLIGGILGGLATVFAIVRPSAIGK